MDPDNSISARRPWVRGFLGVLLLTLLIFPGCRQSGKQDAGQPETGKMAQGKSGDRNLSQIDISPRKKKDPAAAGVDLPTDFRFAWRKETGIDFVHCSGFDEKRVFPAANGSGVGILDFDLDSFADIYFVSGKHFPVDQQEADARNQVYRNLGNWQFDNCSHPTGLDADAYCSGVSVGDFDNDGFQDLYVGCYGPNLLFRNMGDGNFELVQGEGQPHGKPLVHQDSAGELPDTPGWATSSAWLDFNNDGNLDLYVGNYGIWNLELKNRCGNREQNQPRFCSPTSIRAQSDVLYESNGDGTFSDVSEAKGIYTYTQGKNKQKQREDFRTQGVIATDFNEDGLVDLYCGNDMHSNLLLINSRESGFENRTELSSTGYGPNGGSLASMGVAAADANNDGHIDLFCTNFSEEYNSFYKGLGGLQFAEVSKQNRLVDGARPWVGWGAEFIDLDGDGWMEVIVTNGHVDPNIDFFEPGQEHLQPCLIWKNEQGRFRLAKVEGDYFDNRHPGRALAVADLDNDGDADLVIGHQDRSPGILENLCSVKKGAASSFHLVGIESNRDGIGAALRFKHGNAELMRVLVGGGSYLSSHELVLRETRLGKNSFPAISWPSGARNVLDTGDPRQSIEVVIEAASGN